MKDNIKTTLASLCAIGIVLALYSLAAVDYKCRPFEPKRQCKLSRYEVRIHDITEPGNRLIGVAEGACVYLIGEGKSERYVMTDAEFTAANRTDYFDKVEFPAAQSQVCEVR